MRSFNGWFANVKPCQAACDNPILVESELVRSRQPGWIEPLKRKRLTLRLDNALHCNAVAQTDGMLAWIDAAHLTRSSKVFSDIDGLNAGLKVKLDLPSERVVQLASDGIGQDFITPKPAADQTPPPPLMRRFSSNQSHGRDQTVALRPTLDG